jgi:phosphate transport system permease protein
MNLYQQRRLINYLSMSLSVIATGFALVFLCWILWTLLRFGVPHLNLSAFTQNTPPPGSQGGLANAIVGSLILTVGGVLIGTPLGILAGTYLSEYGRGSRLAMLSAPSIVIGVFVYEILVRSMGHFSAYAGTVALALIVIPIVVRTSEDMLQLVSDTMREAAAALGAPQWKVITHIVYRSARPGILTGVLLAIARVSGETAPLLFTALNNQFWSTRLDQPIANLPVVIFQFAMSPYEDWQHLAWVGALIITFSILVLNIIARTFTRGRRPQA